MNQDLEKLAQKVQVFGKENLSDILHYTAVGLKSLFKCHIVRIYLEDLHQGILICQYMTDQNDPDERQITQFISPRDSITSQAFYENKVILSWTLPEGFIKYRNQRIVDIYKDNNINVVRNSTEDILCSPEKIKSI